MKTQSPSVLGSVALRADLILTPLPSFALTSCRPCLGLIGVRA